MRNRARRSILYNRVFVIETIAFSFIDIYYSANILLV